MKTFIYKAKRGPETVVEGSMAAQDKKEVVDKLAMEGLIATSVVDVAEHQGRQSQPRMRYFFGVGIKELILFSRQLATLLKSGIPILRALSILSEQTRVTSFGIVIDDIHERVKNGQPLSAGLKQYPKIFSRFYVAMVKAGEDSGTLDDALMRIASYYTKQFELISKVRTAMAYPILILVVGIVTVVFIFTNVIPRIIPVLIGLRMKLPLPTRVLISFSSFLQKQWPWILLIIILVFLISRRAMKNAAVKDSLSRLALRVPVFGELMFKTEISRFARGLQTALNSGIPIVTAIDSTVAIIHDDLLRTTLASCLKELETGGSFAGALRKAKLFPPFIFNLIGIGEESGKLNAAIGDIADSYERDCEECVRVLTTLLEPIMVLIIGLVVGFIVMAVLLPIFQLNFMQI